MKKILIATLISACAAGSAFAATDGDVGPVSTGTLEVSLNIAALVKISGLDDITLNPVRSPTTGNFLDAVGHTNFCVYADTGGAEGNFTITAQGSGEADAFTLSNGGSDTVSYEVNFAGTPVRTNTVGGEPLTPNQPYVATGASASTAALQCLPDGSADTSTVWVTVPGSEIDGKSIDDYTGTLTLQISAR